MFCPNCGNQIPDDSVFCSFCGSNLQMNTSYAPPVNLEEQSVSSFASVLRKALSSTKFLVMCILVTAAAVLSFAPTTVVVDEMNSTATTSGFDLFAILSTIAMWITYANAKNSEAVMSVSGLKFNAGIAKATFVLNWIGAGIIFVCGIVLCAVGPLLASVYVDEAVLESFYEEITTSCIYWSCYHGVIWDYHGKRIRSPSGKQRKGTDKRKLGTGVLDRGRGPHGK